MAEQAHPLPRHTASNRALNYLGQKWVLSILEYLHEEGAQRFVTIQREGVPGISTEQLRTRLNAMVKDGLLTRTRYKEVPPRVDYELTPKGEDAWDVIRALALWGGKWAEAPHDPEPAEPEAVAA